MKSVHSQLLYHKIHGELYYTFSIQSNHTHLPKKLHVDFGDSIDSPGSLHSDVRTRVARSGRTKGTDRARAEEANIVDFTHVNHVVEAADIHLRTQTHESYEGLLDLRHESLLSGIALSVCVCARICAS